MKKIIAASLAALIAATAAVPAFAADTAELNISADNISHEVSDTLYGVFIEDISKAGDGVLYPTLFITTALNTTTLLRKTQSSMKHIGILPTLSTPFQPRKP